MELEEILGTILSGPMLAAACVVVYLHRQDSQSLHQSIDKNTNALKELAGLINEMRIEQGKVDQQLDSLWHRYKELKEELDELRKCCHCGGSKGGE